jgi:hypothetical protein
MRPFWLSCLLAWLVVLPISLAAGGARQSLHREYREYSRAGEPGCRSPRTQMAWRHGPLTLTIGDEIIDRVLAVVAGNLIMLSDVRAAIELGLVSPGSAPDPVREVLSRLIDRALVLAEVDRYAPPEPAAEAVDRAVQAVRRRFSTPEAFAAALARVGMGDTHLREALREDLRIRAYLDQRFTVVSPTDDELGRYYRDHPDAFTRDGRLVPFDDARQDVAQAVVTDRRRALVDDWVAGLRRQAEITDLYAPAP